MHYFNNSNFGIRALSKINPYDLYKLFVEGFLHHEGLETFENREPGCMKAFYDGFSYALKNINSPLSRDYISKIHYYATKGLGGHFNSTDPGNFRDVSSAPFTVNKKRSTVNGILSIASKIKANHDNKPPEIQGFLENAYKKHFMQPDSYEFDLSKLDLPQELSVIEKVYENSDKWPLNYTPPHAERADVIADVENIISAFDEELSLAKKNQNNDEKILAIVRCIRSFEVSHPFVDGNGRTFVNILLNILLIKNGFIPAMFYESNIFDLYSDEELVDAVKDAMSNTLFSILSPQLTVFGLSPIVDENLMSLRSKQAKVLTTTCSGLIENNIEENELQNYFIELDAYLNTAWEGKINLHRVCALGEIDKIKQYLKDNADLTVLAPHNTAPCYKGYSPLHLAIINNHYEAAKLIINHSFDLALQLDSEGISPFFHAIKSKNIKLVDLFLEHEPNSSLENFNLHCPVVQWAALYGTVEIFQKISSLTRADDQLPICDVLYLASFGGNLNIVKWLIEERKMSLDDIKQMLSCENSNDDPCYQALLNRNTQIFQYIFNSLFQNEKCEIHLFERYCERLIKNKDLQMFEDVLSKTDLSAGQLSISFDSYELALTLYPTNSDILFTLLRIDAKKGNVYSWDGTPMLCYIAAMKNKFDIFIKAIESGVNYLATDVADFSALHYAAMNNQTEIIQYLCETKKMDVNGIILNAAPKFSFFQRTNTTTTPLVFAIKGGCVEATTLLMQLGATIDNQSLENALAECSQNKEEIAQLLKSSLSLSP